MDKVNSFAVYAKGWIASIGGVLTAIILALPSVNVEVPQWLGIVTVVLTAVGVIAIPNAPSAQLKADIINQAVADPNVPVVLATNAVAPEVTVTEAGQLEGH